LSSEDGLFPPLDGIAAAAPYEIEDEKEQREIVCSVGGNSDSQEPAEGDAQRFTPFRRHKFRELQSGREKHEERSRYSRLILGGNRQPDESQRQRQNGGQGEAENGSGAHKQILTESLTSNGAAWQQCAVEHNVSGPGALSSAREVC